MVGAVPKASWLIDSLSALDDFRYASGQPILNRAARR